MVSTVRDRSSGCTDLRDCPREEREPAIERLKDEPFRPFDLPRGPLARLTVVTFGDEHLISIQAHHAISDLWSAGVMMRDLSALYSERVGGPPAVLPALPVQYVDYASWHRTWMAGPQWEREWAYWRRQLEGVRPVDLPTDLPRPANASLEGGVVITALADGVRETVEAVSRRHGVTPYMTLMAGLAVLLRRYTGQDDLVIGAPVAGRQRSDTEHIVGPFINTLAIRMKLAGDPTVRDLLDRVRTVVLDAQAHQDAPFERLIAGLQPAREASHAPIVQVMLNGVGGPSEFKFAGLEAQRLISGWETSLLDLTLYVDLQRMKELAAEYSTDLFEQSTIERLLSQYQVVLAALGEPDRRLSEIALLDDDDRRRLLVEFNQTARAWPQVSSVVALFEARARQDPDRVAVVDAAGRSLTYGQLDARANAVATRLRALGVGTDVLVGVGLERSVNLVVAVLAVWKAGGAYVPLDPAYPQARLAYMLEDSGAPVLLTERSLRGFWPETAAAVVEIEDVGDAGDASAPPRRDDPNQVAYVIYTSGSTGKPKGVEIPQRALINFLRSMAETPGFAGDDVLLAVTTLSFDIAGLELYLPLTTGGRVELASREEASDGHRLLGRIERSGATLLQATPATWRLMLEAGWQETPSLRALCGGEPLPRELADQLLDRCAQVWNMYGPTETTVWSTVDRVERGAPILIGRPIANTQVYVLDNALRPLPIGVPGELFIAGDGVARGYHARPELTAERFVPDPFSEMPGARMYRTGDLARWRADGRLECLGRSDQQVKIRGFRIELGEIESVLVQHSSVRQAVVNVYEPSAGDRRLAAYVVGADGAAIDEAALRAHVRQQLADYMVPSVFVTMASLPLTDNGKVDRKALPAPAAKAPAAIAGAARPANDLERSIAAIWAEVLNVPAVPVDENFFDLGGHSLLFAQVQSRLERQLKLTVPMLELFQFPTVRALAVRLVRPAPAPTAGIDVRRRMDRQLAALDRQRPVHASEREVQ